MSGHGDAHDEAHEDGHDRDEDHHAPPALEEPATPLWLTLLGVGLFLTAGILFIATRPDGKTTAELTAAPSADAPANAAPTPNPAAPPNPGAPNPNMPVRNAPPNPPGMAQPAVRP